MDKYNLPKEINLKVELEADEMEGNYICKKCKGWGYVNERPENYRGLTSHPINLCPNCEGRGIVDWIKRIRQS